MRQWMFSFINFSKIWEYHICINHSCRISVETSTYSVHTHTHTHTHKGNIFLFLCYKSPNCFRVINLILSLQSKFWLPLVGAAKCHRKPRGLPLLHIHYTDLDGTHTICASSGTRYIMNVNLQATEIRRSYWRRSLGYRKSHLDNSKLIMKIVHRGVLGCGRLLLIVTNISEAIFSLDSIWQIFANSLQF